MLRGIHPLLGPDLLHALRCLGHGDEIVIADANFPSHTLGPKVVRLDGIDAVAAADAILTHLPLDTFADAAAFRMEVVGDPTAVPPFVKPLPNSSEISQDHSTFHLWNDLPSTNGPARLRLSSQPGRDAFTAI